MDRSICGDVNVDDANKYRPVYVDIFDATLRDIVEKELRKDLTATHRVSHIVKLDNERWLIRLEYSVLKEPGFMT